MNEPTKLVTLSHLLSLAESVRNRTDDPDMFRLASVLSELIGQLIAAGLAEEDERAKGS